MKNHLENKGKMMNRNDLIKYLQQEYICDVDYPWDKYPDYIIIRRRDNQKWFVGIFTIKGHQVGLEANELMDVVNLKCEPDLIPNLIHESGIYPAYHMNKQHWISVIWKWQRRSMVWCCFP